MERFRHETLRLGSHLPRAHIPGRFEKWRASTLDNSHSARLSRRAVRQHCNDAGRKDICVSLPSSHDNFVSS